jgi:hypothetical protein
MANKEKYMLDPKVDAFTRMFFNVTKFNLTQEQRDELYADFRKTKDPSIIKQFPDVGDIVVGNYQNYTYDSRDKNPNIRPTKQVEAMLETIAGINIANASVRNLLSRIDFLRDNKPDRLCELEICKDLVSENDRRIDIAVASSLEVIAYDLLSKRKEWHQDRKARPNTMVVGADPMIAQHIQHTHGSNICGFNLHIVSSLHISMRGKVIISLCDLEKPNGNLYVGRWGIETASRRNESTLFMSHLLYQHTANDASMGKIELK